MGDGGLRPDRDSVPPAKVEPLSQSVIESAGGNLGDNRPGQPVVPGGPQSDAPVLPGTPGAPNQPADTTVGRGRPLGQDSLDSRFGQPDTGEKRPLVNDVVPGRPGSTRTANNVATEQMHMSTPTGVAKPVTVELRDGGGTQNMTRIKAEDGRTVLYSQPNPNGSGERFFRQDGNRLVQTDKQGQPVPNGESLNVRNIQVGRQFEAPVPGGPRPNQPAPPTDQAQTKRPSNPPPENNPHRTVPPVPGDQGPGRRPGTPANPVDQTNVPGAKPQPGAPRPGDQPTVSPPTTVRGGGGDGPSGPAGPRGPNPHRVVPPTDAPRLQPGNQGPQDQPTGRGPNRGPEGPGQPGGPTQPGGPGRREVQDQTQKGPQGDRGTHGPADRAPVVPVPVPGRGDGPGGTGGPSGRGDGERGGKPGPGDRPDIPVRGGDRGVGGGGRPDLLDKLLEGKPGAKPLDPRILELIGDPRLQQKLMDTLQRGLGDRDSLSPRIKEIFRDLDEKQLVALQRGLLDGLKNPFNLDRLDPQLQGKLRDLSEALGGKQLATGRLLDGMVRDGVLVPGRDTLTTVIRDMDRTSKLFETSDKSSREVLSEMLVRGLDRNQFLIGTESGGSRVFTMRMDADEASMKSLVDRLQSNVLTTESIAAARELNAVTLANRSSEDDSTNSLSRLMEDGDDGGSPKSKVEEVVKAIVAKEIAVSLAKPGDPAPATATRPENQGARLPEGPRPQAELETATALPTGEKIPQPILSMDDGTAENKTREEKRTEEKPTEKTGPTPEEIAALAQRKLDEERKRREREEETRRLDAERKEKEKKNKRGSYRVRHGDSLVSIAQSQCSDGNLAPLIYDINRGRIAEKFIGVRRCAVLKVNQNLTLPSENDITNFKRWGGRSNSLDFSHPAGAPDVLVAPEGGFVSAEAELAAKFGMAWGGSASGVGKSRFDDGKEVKGSRTDRVKAKIKQNRHHIEAALGPLRQTVVPQENRIRYVCRIGDTLRSVALRHASLQDVKLWELIALVNELPRDMNAKGEPSVKLVRGQTLLLPTPAEIQAWRAGTFQNETTFAVLNDGGYIELVGRECPHCGRPTLVTAVICPGCGSDMDAELDDEEATGNSAGAVSGESSIVDQQSERSPSDRAVENAEAAPADPPRGYDTEYDLPALSSAPIGSLGDDQIATSDEIQGYYEMATRGQLHGTSAYQSEADADSQLALDQSATADQLSSISKPRPELDVSETVDVGLAVADSEAKDEQTGTVILSPPKGVADRRDAEISAAPQPPPLPAYARNRSVETGAPLSRGDSREPHYLSVNSRLIIEGSPDDLNAGYRVTLEGMYDRNWIMVACYEFYEDVILHHTADQFGKKKTRRIALPIRQALQLAENDLTTNWYQYMRGYSTGI
ncbi:MAG: LysM peptidoglycan-binding domain-containing protein [Candidatus Obscuribacterales bacterium]|nr:LysM peptidoglycan-binding domain-containing protein [Candidatus Obscuribacterales bacterium]